VVISREVTDVLGGGKCPLTRSDSWVNDTAAAAAAHELIFSTASAIGLVRPVRPSESVCPSQVAPHGAAASLSDRQQDVPLALSLARQSTFIIGLICIWATPLVRRAACLGARIFQPSLVTCRSSCRNCNGPRSNKLLILTESEMKQAENFLVR